MEFLNLEPEKEVLKTAVDKYNLLYYDCNTIINI